jgi:hypothetical protein
MVFDNYNATTGIATWSSTSNTTWNSASGTISIPTELEIQFQPYGTESGTGYLSEGFLTPTTTEAVGITGFPSDYPVFQVTGDYQVWEEYIAEGTGGGAALLDYFDSSHADPGDSISTDSSGGFFSTAVPEPSSWGLWVVALLFSMRMGSTLIRKR